MRLKEFLNEKRSKYDSEYLKTNAEILSDDMRDEGNLSIVFDMIASRINQSYPGNTDLSLKDVKDLLDPRFLRKYKDDIQEALEILFEM